MKQTIAKTVFLISAILALPLKGHAAFNNENLNYHIIYHWGIVWKHAGSANLSLHDDGNNYSAKLTAHTRSWADKIFKVRDTLTCTIEKAGFRPVTYLKNAHEGKSLVRDIVKYSYDGATVSAHCTHNRVGKQPQISEFQATGKAFDMLSIFYFIRTLRFDKMSHNTIYTATVFSGRRKETIKIRYIGTENIELRDKSKHNAYHIKFSFTQDGQQKSSDDMDTWISTDSSKIPLMLRGKLPLGEVRCYYAR